MKCQIGSFVVLLILVSCKSKVEREQLTFIAGTEYLFYYKGDTSKVNNADSILFGGNNVDELKKLSAILNKNETEIVIKPTIVGSGVTKFQILQDWLNQGKFAYKVVDSIATIEKKRFNVQDIYDYKKWQAKIKSEEDLQQRLMDNPNFVDSIKEPCLIFFLDKTGKVFYKYRDLTHSSALTEIKPSTSFQIVNKLTELEKQYNIELKRLLIILEGDRDSKYGDSKKITEALNQQELYKYYMVPLNSTNR